MVVVVVIMVAVVVVVVMMVVVVVGSEHKPKPNNRTIIKTLSVTYFPIDKTQTQPKLNLI